MTSEAVSTTALSTVFSLALLWVLAMLYRQHRIDLFRHEMFILRAELFDYARRGEIEFDHPAYAGLRTTLNGFLRFAERVGFVSLWLNLSVLRRVPPDSNIWWWERHWQEALGTLDPELKTEFVAIRERMHFELFKHLLLSSPFLLATIVPVAVASVVQNAGRKLVWNLFRYSYRRCEEFFERRVSRPFDALAYRAGGTA
jgi:hypothetical protein